MRDRGPTTPEGRTATDPSTTAPVDASARDLGEDATVALVDALLLATGARKNLDLLRALVETSVQLARDGVDRLDLKLARSAVAEMADAFRMFAPYRASRKVTIFGSARTEPSDDLYDRTRALATRFAEAGWMVVTGAGPGIMAAGNEGAGREMAIGVNIRLPFETEPNEWIADEKLVEMKYFFTRKVMLMKESSGFLVLPGGFGTLDECFELLTLLQTGKAEPAPIVLVEPRGETYWEGWQRFVSEQVFARGLADPLDAHLYRITDDVDVAVGEILGFYANYHSRRFVGPTMIVRLKHAPTEAECAALSVEFADIVTPAGIRRVGASAPERASRDHLELERIAMEFDRTHHGRLRQLIDALNALAPGA